MGGLTSRSRQVTFLQYATAPNTNRGASHRPEAGHDELASVLAQRYAGDQYGLPLHVYDNRELTQERNGFCARRSTTSDQYA